MFKQNKYCKGEKGFTLIELLVVAAIIGILLALAIPNLLKARISANEANAAKMMQVLRDAEGEYYEMDLNNDGIRNYTKLIGKDGTGDSLRQPHDTDFVELNALVDLTFERIDAGENAANCAGVGNKAGYCITHDTAGATANTDAQGGFDDYGWQATMSSFNKNGRRDYSVYSDGTIRCLPAGAGDPTATPVVPGLEVGKPGEFDAGRDAPGCS